MKSVLLSIQPEWCAKIANDEKTIEVRKNKPKLETPFKCYIYCTSNAPWLVYGDVLVAGGVTEKYTVTSGRSKKEADKIWGVMNGKVIGEFVCDSILPISVEYSNPNHNIANREFPFTCLTDKQIMDYLGNGKEGFGWHISNLVIYDEPKMLKQFCLPLEQTGLSWKTPLKRPPQSWCYAEELKWL